MITAIIETRDSEVALAQALTRLVPAATEGVLQDVVVVDRGSADGTLAVADAAGCTIIEAEKLAGDVLRRAAEAARGDWLLFLSPDAVLAAGWQDAAMAFIDRALLAGRAPSSVAILYRGAMVTGWRARLLALGFVVDGRLIAKAAYLAASPSASPSAASLASGARRGAA